jgi:hypothetical protein
VLVPLRTPQCSRTPCDSTRRRRTPRNRKARTRLARSGTRMTQAGAALENPRTALDTSSLLAGAQAWCGVGQRPSRSFVSRRRGPRRTRRGGAIIASCQPIHPKIRKPACSTVSCAESKVHTCPSIVHIHRVLLSFATRLVRFILRPGCLSAPSSHRFALRSSSQRARADSTCDCRPNG